MNAYPESWEDTVRMCDAAPTMLAALKATLECTIPAKLRVQIEAAVAKARGTEPLPVHMPGRVGGGAS